jgi:hypothetical protein
MKLKILTSIAVTTLTTCVFGQGLLLTNGGNTGGPTATTFGLVYELVSGSTNVFNGTTYDLGVTVSFGTSAGSLTPYGTYTPATDSKGYTGYGSGAFYLGPFTGGAGVTVPGAVAGGSTWVELQIWDYDTPGLGDSHTYANYAAAAAGGDDVGTVIFLQTGLSNPYADPPEVAPPLTDMPSVVLQPVPEPATFALAGLGIASLLAFHRRS